MYPLHQSNVRFGLCMQHTQNMWPECEETMWPRQNCSSIFDRVPRALHGLTNKHQVEYQKSKWKRYCEKWAICLQIILAKKYHRLQLYDVVMYVVHGELLKKRRRMNVSFIQIILHVATERTIWKRRMRRKEGERKKHCKRPTCLVTTFSKSPQLLYSILSNEY